MMNDDNEQIENLVEQIYEQKALADRYRSALQDIRENAVYSEFNVECIKDIVREALERE